MVKAKRDVTADPDWDGVAGALAVVLPGAETDRRDGLRMAAGEEWVHLRKSGTEPVLRAIAEAPTRERASQLVDAALAALGAV